MFLVWLLQQRQLTKCLFSRMDSLLGARPGQLSHPSYLHSQVSSADHGLSDQRLLLQTAGKSSVPLPMSSLSSSFGVQTGEDRGPRLTAASTTRWIKFKSKANVTLRRTALSSISTQPDAFLFPSPGRSCVRRKSTTCWWPHASIRSWRPSERSFTTACWRPEMWTVSSPQVDPFPLLDTRQQKHGKSVVSVLRCTRNSVKYS